MEFNYDEEIICDYKVSAKMKKIWAKEIELLQVFDKVCKKYNLKYYVFYGTLLGAIRHKGFIPWDDDIDVVMSREDYTKLQEIADQEFHEPYFFQNAYNDEMLWAISKLRNSNTTAVEFPDLCEDFNQGIFIDIFPLDAAMDGTPRMDGIFKVERDIWRCLFSAEQVLPYLENEEALKKYFVLDRDTLIDFLQMSGREKMQQLELFAGAHYNDSDELCVITFSMGDVMRRYKKEWFEEIIYMPFCNIEVPVPKMYDEILRTVYGDYTQFVRGGTCHDGIFLDPDMPYKEWLKKNRESK